MRRGGLNGERGGLGVLGTGMWPSVASADKSVMLLEWRSESMRKFPCQWGTPYGMKWMREELSGWGRKGSGVVTGTIGVGQSECDTCGE